MPNPISASACTNLQDTTPEELDSGMCLTARPSNDGSPRLNVSATASSSPSPSALSANLESPPLSAPASPPGASVLVARFYEPRSSAPPVQPSLTQAFMNCKAATASYVGTVGAVLLSAPESFGLSFALGATRMAAAAGSLDSCLDSNQAKQASAATTAELSDTCRNDGAIPLSTADGKVVCLKP